MDAQALRESVTDAIRFWEFRRLAYNAVLAFVVLFYFGKNYPVSRGVVTLDGVLFLFLLVVLANVAYCAAYVVDVFAQMSGYREQWRKRRWMLFAVGVLFAGVITRFWSLAFFQNGQGH